MIFYTTYNGYQIMFDKERMEFHAFVGKDLRGKTAYAVMEKIDKALNEKRHTV